MQARSVDSRDKKPHFLIVCEGKETEKNYFQSFRLKITVEVIGTGFNTETLVNYTLELQEKAKKEEQPYEQVWVVFDRDSFPPDDFNNAIFKAQQAGFGVAYSNEAFELWYILHFDYMPSGVSRAQYKQMLTKRLERPYKKNDPTIYGRLQAKQAVAINNAKHLLASHQPGHNPARDNPCTLVYELVMELNKYMA